MDVEEVDRGVQRRSRSSDYVAHRLSDGQLFDCITVSEVPLVLKTVYDHDVISFAEKHYFTTSATSTTGGESGAELGAGRRGGSVVESDERSQSVTVGGVSGTWTKGSKAEPREEREQHVEDKDKQGRREQDIRGSKGDNTQKDNDLLSRS
jgi:hypothetical protein